MNKTIWGVFLLMVVNFCIGFTTIKAQPKTEVELHDTAKVNVRIPMPENIREYKELEEYNYTQFKEGESLWSKIVNWLLKFLKEVGITPKGLNYGLIAVACGIILFVVLRLLGIKPSGIFIFKHDRKVNQLRFQQVEDDVYNEELEKILQTCIRNGAYREAVRILYLLCIRLLDENSWIEWKNWKTNKDYYYELIKYDTHTMFKNLIRNYEYVWYGQFKIDEQLFKLINKEFGDFEIYVKQHKSQSIKEKSK